MNDIVQLTSKCIYDNDNCIVKMLKEYDCNIYSSYPFNFIFDKYVKHLNNDDLINIVQDTTEYEITGINISKCNDKYIVEEVTKGISTKLEEKELSEIHIPNNFIYVNIHSGINSLLFSKEFQIVHLQDHNKSLKYLNIMIVNGKYAGCKAKFKGWNGTYSKWLVGNNIVQLDHLQKIIVLGVYFNVE